MRHFNLEDGHCELLAPARVGDMRQRSRITFVRDFGFVLSNKYGRSGYFDGMEL